MPVKDNACITRPGGRAGSLRHGGQVCLPISVVGDPACLCLCVLVLVPQQAVLDPQAVHCAKRVHVAAAWAV